MSDLLNETMPDLPKDEEASKSGIVLDMIGIFRDLKLLKNYFDGFNLQMILPIPNSIHGVMMKQRAFT